MYAVHICFDAYGALLNEEYNYLYYTNNLSAASSLEHQFTL